MGTRFDSYVQGFREAAQQVGVAVPPGMEAGDSPDVEKDSLDRLEYMRGQVSAMLQAVCNQSREIASLKAGVSQAANVASCLANGIKPD